VPADATSTHCPLPVPGDARGPWPIPLAAPANLDCACPHSVVNVPPGHDRAPRSIRPQCSLAERSLAALGMTIGMCRTTVLIAWPLDQTSLRTPSRASRTRWRERDEGCREAEHLVSCERGVPVVADAAQTPRETRVIAPTGVQRCFLLPSWSTDSGLGHNGLAPFGQCSA